MATKDKLPTFEQIWGSPAPTVIKASRTAMELINSMIASRAKPARTAKRIRKPTKGSKRK